MPTIRASQEATVSSGSFQADVGYPVGIRIVLVFGNRAWPSPYTAATLVGKRLLNVLGSATILGRSAAARFGVSDGDRTSFLLYSARDGMAHPVETTVKVHDRYGSEAFILSWQDVIGEFDPVLQSDGTLELRARNPSRCFIP